MLWLTGYRLYTVNVLDCLNEDVSSHLDFPPGYVRARGLAPGHYALLDLESGATISSIHVTKADKEVVTGPFTRLSNHAQATCETSSKPLQVCILRCGTLLCCFVLHYFQLMLSSMLFSGFTCIGDATMICCLFS